MTTRHDQAPAASTAHPRRRLGLALLLALVVAAAVAAAADQGKSTVYIWRDAGGVVRFSAAPPPR
ncbi:DUF4124 domain-containing protein [bacterium]|nr:DUF4124 domain-containing protein [bacterium]